MRYFKNNFLIFIFAFATILLLASCGSSSGGSGHDNNGSDKTPPLITLIGSPTMDVKQNSVFADPGAKAVDNIDGDITSKISVDGYVDTSKEGSYELIYSVVDSSGNSSSISRIVNVYSSCSPIPQPPCCPNTPPTITLLGANPMNLKVGDTFTDPGAIAQDKEDGNLTSKITVTGIVDTSKAGTYTLTYKVTDSGGLSASITRSVVVSGTPSNPPVLTLLPFCNDINYTVDKNRPEFNNFLDPGATAMDDIDGDITSKIIVSGGPVDSSVVKDYTLTYTVTDSSNNTVTASRMIRVVESNITLTGQVKSYGESGAVSVNNCSLKDDGFYQSGKVVNFIRDDAKDIVTDKSTDLVWQDDDDVSNAPIVRPDVSNYCTNLNLGGYTDWRVPEIWELMTLVDKSKYDSAIYDTFKHVYKTALGYTYSNTDTVNPRVQGDQWMVSFLSGLDVDDNHYTNVKYGVRCVRGNMLAPSGQGYTKDANNIISNNNTGLEWVDNDITNGVTKSWKEAIDFCENLNAGGYMDWRLPNINEYYSVFDYTKNAIGTPFNLNSVIYLWSSTTSANTTERDKAWRMKPVYGDSSPKDKSNIYHFMCVRNK